MIGFGISIPEICLRGSSGPVELYDPAAFAVANFGGTTATWDAGTNTITSPTTGSASSYPRLNALNLIETGKTYNVEITVTSGTSRLFRAGTTSGANFVPASGGSISGSFTAGFTTFEIHFNGLVTFTNIISVTLTEA